MGARVGLDRAAVLREAAHIVDGAGSSEALTLKALALALGVQTPSLYNYMDGLPGLRLALAQHALETLGDTIATATIGKSRGDAVRAVAHAYRGFVHAHSGLYGAMLAIDYTVSADPALDVASSRVVAIVLAVLSAYNLGEEEAVHAVRGLRASLHGFVSLEAAHQFGMPVEVDESFRRLIETHIAALESAVDRDRRRE